MRIIALIIAALFLCAPAYGFNQAARIQGGICGELKGSASTSRSAELEAYRAIIPDAVIVWNCAGTCADASTETDIIGNTITATSTASSHKGYRHGGGSYYSFSVAEGGYFNAGDSASFSFGNGSNDSPVTLGAWIRRTSAVSGPTIFSKGFNPAGGGEYACGAPLGIGAYYIDASEGIYSTSGSSAVVAYDSAWHLVVITYDGTGGSSAMNGTQVYYDGSPTSMDGILNDPAYVAMENTATDLTIGGSAILGSALGDISIAFITAKEMSSNEVLFLYEKTKKFYQ